MQYNYPLEDFPDYLVLPTKYKATPCECRWDEYTEGTEWGFYYNGGSNITGCAACMEKCDLDPSCGSVECGEDQPLLDGSIIPAHCTWWRNGTCQTEDEFKLNPNNFIVTAKKLGKGLVYLQNMFERRIKYFK